MDWIRQNNFLAALGGITLVGVLGLGFLAFKNFSGYSAAQQEFESMRDKLSGLEDEALHPNPENLAMVKADADAYEKEVDALFKKLESAQPPLPTVEPGATTKFGEKIQAELAVFQEKAAKLNVTVGDNFYMGMDSYRAQTPTEAILPQLEWALGGIARLANLTLESGIETMDQFRRYEEPWEKEAPKPVVEEKPKKGSKPKPKPKAAKGAAPVIEMADMLESSRVRMRLTGSPDSINTLINSISNDETYFYWIRWAKIANETPSGPSKGQVFNAMPIIDEEGVPVAADAITPAAEVDASSEAVAPPMIDVFPILGTERVRIDLVIDITRFRIPAEPEKPEPKKKR